MLPLVAPVVMTLVSVGPVAVPSVDTSTVERVPVVVTARMGTSTTPVRVLVVIVAVTDEPMNSLVGSPVKATVTG